MLFHDNQLMKNEVQLRLFLVENLIAFARYEDHEAALHIQLHELVSEAQQQDENPIMLIEEVLQTTYRQGDSTEEIANFLAQTGEMQRAMSQLEEHWSHRDTELPDLSLTTGGTSKKEAQSTFMHTNLRNYLEALTSLRL